MILEPVRPDSLYRGDTDPHLKCDTPCAIIPYFVPYQVVPLPFTQLTIFSLSLG